MSTPRPFDDPAIPLCDGDVASTRRSPARRWKPASGGYLLLESVVGLALMVLVGGAVVTGLSTASRSLGATERQAVAETLARSQLEFTFSVAYLPPPSIYPTVTPPPQFAVSAHAEEYVPGDPLVERLRVTVSHDGEPVLVLETLRSAP